MCPEKANVYLVEDDNNFRKVIKDLLEKEGGHIVVFEAGDLSSALDGVKLVDKLNPHVALLDGNLTQGDHSCSDGIEVAAALREAKPDIKIVSVSGEEGVSFGDVNVHKNYRNLDAIYNLPQVVTDL